MEIIITAEQFGFRKGRLSVDNISGEQQIVREHREINTETDLVFLDYELEFDGVESDVLWEEIENRGVTSF